MPGMQRSRGKGGGSHRDNRPVRRAPPPAATGLEAEFFEQARRGKLPLVLTLIDGTTICGIVREFDRDQVTIEDSSGNIVVRKREIRYLAQE